MDLESGKNVVAPKRIPEKMEGKRMLGIDRWAFSHLPISMFLGQCSASEYFYNVQIEWIRNL